MNRTEFMKLLCPMLTGLCLLTGGASVLAQDFYDPTVLRQVAIQFDDANWEALLRQNYVSETNILADLTVDGTTYEDVGVRIRGNTSFTALPSGSQKFSLHVDVDFVHAGQEVMGYNNLNFNNGFRDPTFTREVVYNNLVARYIPNPRASNVVLSLNGQNWGVYINLQQIDKRMLRRYFADDDGLRIKCSNIPNGPGLTYNGPNASGYSVYEIQETGGLANPVQALIDVTDALTNEPLASWPNIDLLFAIDPSIWSVVLENLLTDDDSYVNKGCDFMTYRDPLDARMHLLQRDANETFSAPTWSLTRNFSAPNKPFLSRVLAVPELRQRYMAHYRVALTELDWAVLGPLFQAQRDLIDAAVQADPKKLYTYQNFLDNFSSNVTLAQPGLAGGNLVGLQPFVTQRAAMMAGIGELTSTGPAISNAQPSNDAPDPGEDVYIAADVTATGATVAQVQLYYRTPPSTVYLSVPMLDDGLSGDGAPGDGRYGALLPITAQRGQQVQWYVSATADNAFDSLSFEPVLAERGPRLLDYFAGSNDGVRITEWAYSGGSGEFIELTNLGQIAVDLSGWSLDDGNATPGSFDLSAIGVLQPGQSAVITDAVEASFRTSWSLSPDVPVIGELGVVSGNNLGRNDEIHLFNASGATEDRLYYGDQDYPGTIRTQNVSGQVGCAAAGFNEVAAWVLSAPGDEFASVTSVEGDIGAPGRYPEGLCELFADGFE